MNLLRWHQNIFSFPKKPCLSFGRIRLKIAAWLSHVAQTWNNFTQHFFTQLQKNCWVIQLFVMEEVPVKVRVSWERLPASTGRFCNTCAIACSKYIQRVQKVKGRYKVRETPGIWDIPSGAHLKELFFIPWFCLFFQKKQQFHDLVFIPPEGIVFYSMILFFFQKKQQFHLFFIPPEGIAFCSMHDGNNQHQHTTGCPRGLCFVQALSSPQDSYAIFCFIPLTPWLAL